MEDSKLVQIFNKLSGFQLASLRKLVFSPFFNKRTDVQRLFEYLCQTQKKKKPNYDKASVWKACFGQDLAYEPPTLGLIMSLLLELLEEFLYQSQLPQTDSCYKYPHLVEAYSALQLPKHTKHALESWKNTLQKSQIHRNSTYFRQIYEYEQALYLHTEPNPDNLQSAVSALDKQFIAEKLRQACELLAQQNRYKNSYDAGLLAYILPYVEAHQSELLQYPAISLYYYYYKALTEANEAYFGLYARQLLEVRQEFPPEELKDLYKMGINYAIRQANLSDKSEYIRQAWLVYKQALEQQLLFENGILSRFSYKNMVALGLRLGELDWVQDFIRTNTSFLAPKYQHIYEQYALGKYCFSTQNYPQALLHFQQVAYEEIFLGLDARVVQLKIFYETEEWEVLDSHLQSFKMFLIRRRRHLAYHYENYKNIIRFSLRLMRLQAFSKPKLQQLREKITTTPTLTEREWLLKMLAAKK